MRDPSFGGIDSPGNPISETVDVFGEELSNYTTGKDTIQFPYNKALHADLIRKIAAHRAWDVRENNSLWMHRSEIMGKAILAVKFYRPFLK